MEQYIQIETLIFELLLVVTVVAIVVQRLRVPYTVALVVVGLAIALWQPFKIYLTPELILFIFIPPLVFEAAFHLRFEDLRQNLFIILLLAIPGVILTTLITGGILACGAKLTLQVAFLFGALIAATDPIAVVSLFRSLGLPNRLSVLIEGEGLLNDGTAIVIFNIVLAVILTDRFDLMGSIADFFRVAAGGTIIGLTLGYLISRIIYRIDDHLIETTLTVILAFGAYLIAERLGFSGVLAVVAAGVVNGNIGPQGMSPTTRIVIFNFWEFIAFIANSLVFLLIGLEINLQSVLISWQPVLWGVIAILIARTIIVYGLGWFVKRTIAPIPYQWQAVLVWGGLRGAICLALALSLPDSFGGDRDVVRLMAFGVVLFTLLVQGMTMKPLIHKLHLVSTTEAQLDFELRQARLTTFRAAVKHIENLHHQGLLSSHAWEKIRPELEKQLSSLTEHIREILILEPSIEAEEMELARRELLQAQKSAILGMRRDGMLSGESFEQLLSEIDLEIEKPEA